MFRKCVNSLITIKYLSRHRSKCILCIPGSIFIVKASDGVSGSNDDSGESESETGLDRVKNLFEYNGYGSYTPQISMVFQSTLLSFITAAMIGATIESRKTYVKFMEENHATKFESHLEAKRQLTDRMFLAHLRGGTKLGWRISLFTTLAMLTMVSVEAYRGKSTPLDFTAGGAVAGLLWKTKDGPKPMVAGTVFGGLFGLTSGIIIHSLLWLTGFTMADVYKYEGDDIDRTSKAKMAAEKEAREESSSTNLHELMIEDSKLKEAKE